jgi:hypothetical protein
MEITRNGSRPSGKGPEAYFTGTVRVDPVFQVGDPARVSGGLVTVEPGARSAWHTHPLGQTLIVTSGLGWAQTEGGRSKKSVPAMSCGFHPARSIGMAYRGHGIAQWQERRLDGKGQRLAVLEIRLPRDVAYWPIASFSCCATIRRLSGHSGPFERSAWQIYGFTA